MRRKNATEQSETGAGTETRPETKEAENKGDQGISEGTAVPAAEEKKEEIDGSPGCVVTVKPNPIDIGSSVIYRSRNELYAAIITAVKGDAVELVYFAGKGSGAANGATKVKRGLKPGEWWPNAADMRAAIDDGIQ